MSGSHVHPRKTIWEALDADGRRLGVITAETGEQALAQGNLRFGMKLKTIRDTGSKRKPSKCCSDCSDDAPCGGEKK